MNLNEKNKNYDISIHLNSLYYFVFIAISLFCFVFFFSFAAKSTYLNCFWTKPKSNCWKYFLRFPCKATQKWNFCYRDQNKKIKNKKRNEKLFLFIRFIETMNFKNSCTDYKCFIVGYVSCFVCSKNVNSVNSWLTRFRFGLCATHEHRTRIYINLYIHCGLLGTRISKQCNANKYSYEM